MAHPTAENSTEKQRHGFQPGKSGNPRGKPPGTRNKATVAAEALLAGEAEALTRKAVEMALAGDPIALRLCLDRVLPVPKSRRLTLDLTPEAMADPASAISLVQRAMLAGEIDPDTAARALDVLGGRPGAGTIAASVTISAPPVAPDAGTWTEWAREHVGLPAKAAPEPAEPEPAQEAAPAEPAES